MSKIRVKVGGYEIDVLYDYAPAFKGSKVSPPTKAELDVIDWDFVDANAKEDCGEKDYPWLLRTIDEYLQGEILYDVIELENRKSRNQKYRFSRR